jgi:hypothetical protein
VLIEMTAEQALAVAMEFAMLAKKVETCGLPADRYLEIASIFPEEVRRQVSELVS